MLSLKGFSTHIVGGGFDVQHLSGNRYQLSLIVYRDCSSRAEFNDPLVVGIFDKVTHKMIGSFWMRKLSQTPINPAKAQCLTQVPGCNEKAFYSKEIVLDTSLYNNNEGYYFSWERCCRNNSIGNLVNPGDASMAFYAEIPSPKRYINSTPKLVVNPFTVLCRNNFFSYDIKFSEKDGDSVVYSLIDPLNGTLDRFRPNDDNSMLNSGPYTVTEWLPGFSKDSAIQGSPSLSIDHKTGRLSVNPSDAGVFVLALRVTEYRKGVLLGFVNLELQLTVIDCPSSSPLIKLHDAVEMKSGNNLYVRIPEEIQFRVEVQFTNDLDSITVESDLDNEPGEKVEYSVTKGQRSAKLEWKWKTYCELHDSKPRKITVTAVDKGCPIPRSSQRTFYVNVLPMPLLPSTDVLCMELQNNRQVKIHFGDSTRTLPYFKQYNLYRSRTANDPFTLLDSSNIRNAEFFLDADAPDYTKINYRYFIRTKNECGYSGNTSDTLGTFDQIEANPAKHYIYNASVRNNSVVDVYWDRSQEVDFARYFIYRGARGELPEQFINVGSFSKKTDTLFTDLKVNVHDTSYCYYLIVLDTCGNLSVPGQLFCTTVIKGKSYPFESQLNWMRFKTSDEHQAEYNLIRYLPEKADFKDLGFLKDTMARDIGLKTDEGRYEYEVNVIHEPYGNKGRSATSKSNRKMLFQAPKTYIPTAFSPNGDGYNDTWMISDVFMKDFGLKVYNRWGQLIFETSDKNKSWNGKDMNGNDVPADVYMFILTYTGWDKARVYNNSGNVTLIR